MVVHVSDIVGLARTQIPPRTDYRWKAGARDVSRSDERFQVHEEARGSAQVRARQRDDAAPRRRFHRKDPTEMQHLPQRVVGFRESILCESDFGRRRGGFGWDVRLIGGA